MNRRCDTDRGPCACGAWHGGADAPEQAEPMGEFDAVLVETAESKRRRAEPTDESPKVETLLSAYYDKGLRGVWDAGRASLEVELREARESVVRERSYRRDSDQKAASMRAEVERLKSAVAIRDDARAVLERDCRRLEAEAERLKRENAALLDMSCDCEPQCRKFGDVYACHVEDDALQVLEKLEVEVERLNRDHEWSETMRKATLESHGRLVTEVERLKAELYRARRDESDLRDEIGAAFRKHGLAAGPQAVEALCRDRAELARLRAPLSDERVREIADALCFRFQPITFPWSTIVRAVLAEAQKDRET